MQRSKHRKRKHRRISEWPDTAPIPGWVAHNARYVGSPEHKSFPSDAGAPALRSDASRCDPGLDLARLNDILKIAIHRGCVSEVFEGWFPKYVWGWVEGDLYEARHINGPQGTYKGYLLEPIEYPQDPDGRLAWNER